MANLSIVKTNEGRTIFSPTGRPLFALVTIKEHTFTSSERHFVRCYDGAVLAHFQGGEVTINGIKSKADQLFHARSTLGKLFSKTRFVGVDGAEYKASRDSLTDKVKITRIHGDSDGEVLLYFQLKNFLSDKPGTVQLLNPPLFLDMYENPSPLLQDLLLKCVAFLAYKNAEDQEVAAEPVGASFG